MLKKLKKNKGITEPYNQFQDLLTEYDCKKGKVRVYRIASSDKGYKRNLVAMDISVSELINENVENWLMESFGGGEYEVKIWKLEDDKSNRVKGCLTYRFDGPSSQNKDTKTIMQEIILSRLKDSNPINILGQLTPLITTILNAALGNKKSSIR